MRGHPFDRWAAKVEATYECWNWTGAKYRGGYGHFRLKVGGKWKMYKAHRFAYENYKGPIPEGMLIRHTCDNPSCVNPDHLVVGTNQDNTNDRKERKGIPLIRNPRHKNLDLNVARAVRLAYTLSDKPQKDIAALFGISKQQCSRILRNEIWAEEN